MDSTDLQLEGISVLKDESTKNDNAVALPYDGLVQVIRGKFEAAKTARLYSEQRWLKAYKNFRGVYESSMRYTDEEKSKVFVKITKTKTLAAYGQLLEVLFAASRFPISIQPTEKPEGIAEVAHVGANADPMAAQQEQQDVYGYKGDGKQMAPGTTYNDLLGGLDEKYGKLPLEEGPAQSMSFVPELRPAEKSAKEMEKVILDQLGESRAENVLRHALFEMALLGEGVVKGPFTTKKIYNKWIPGPEGNTYEPVEKLVPTVEAVSIWNFYPDPHSISMDDAEWVVQRHFMNRSQFRQLLKAPHFRPEAIRKAIENGPNWTREWFETEIVDNDTQSLEIPRWEILEYWGVMDKEMAIMSGLADSDKISELDEVQINAWICGGELIRLVLNPFTPARIPFHACPYEINPYQFFGIGVPENMDDCQMIMNGHARMAIDNLALAGNLVFDIDESALVPGQDMKIYPGKIFRREAGSAGQAVFGLKFPSTAVENLQMFDKFRQLADEATGIPSYSHGTTGVQSTTRTAAGMSMLMGAAALNIKTVIKNIDDFLLRPLGEALFAWNMQFKGADLPEIHGDLEVKARGTSSLLQKEVKSQRLMTFLQLAANPSLAPFIKLHTLVKEIAESLDVDADKIINDPSEAQFQAMLIGMAGGMGKGMDEPVDPTGAGGGNIGTGSAPQPGEKAFSGSDQSANVKSEGSSASAA
jgi:hypothetical protein